MADAASTLYRPCNSSRRLTAAREPSECSIQEVDGWITLTHNCESPATVDIETCEAQKTISCSLPAASLVRPQLSHQSFEVMWTLTTEFLSRVRAVTSMRGTSSYGARKRLFRRVDNSQVIAVALQHLSSALPFSAPSTTNADRTRKKGKKRESHCPLCSDLFPYSKDLILHMREVHGIRKSKSLMYKRIKQGREAIERLYL